MDHIKIELDEKHPDLFWFNGELHYFQMDTNADNNYKWDGE